MEEAIVDVTLAVNRPLPKTARRVVDQEDMFTDKQNQTQILANAQKSSPASHSWPQNRVAWVETLRVSVVSGTYQVDSTELAQCLLRNSTRFLETC